MLGNAADDWSRWASEEEETNHCEKCGVEIDIYGTHCERHEEAPALEFDPALVGTFPHSGWF